MIRESVLVTTTIPSLVMERAPQAFLILINFSLNTFNCITVSMVTLGAVIPLIPTLWISRILVPGRKESSQEAENEGADGEEHDGTT